MKASELRQKSDKELLTLASKASQELKGMYVELRTKEIKKVHEFKLRKRMLARLHTILREKEILAKENNDG